MLSYLLEFRMETWDKEIRQTQNCNFHQVDMLTHIRFLWVNNAPNTESHNQHILHLRCHPGRLRSWPLEGFSTTGASCQQAFHQGESVEPSIPDPPQRLCNPISSSKALWAKGAAVTIAMECKPEKKKGTRRRETCRWLWVQSRSDSAPWTKCAGGVSYAEEEWGDVTSVSDRTQIQAPGNLRNGWTVYEGGV